MSIKISFFNHKGGVSKTTSVFHIGWKLAEMGKKVLLIDADSQCNLTLLALGTDSFENHYKNKPNDNIMSALIPAFKAQTHLIKPVECIEVRDNLFLMPGHIDLSSYEVQLGLSFQLNSFGTMQNIPGSFNFLFEKTAQKYDAEYILIDLNPSFSAINQDLVLSSDYFIIPTSPDYFSLMALKSLANVLPKWESWAINARLAFEDAVYPFPNNIPKFLGYTVNNFNLRNGVAASAANIIITEIDTTIREVLIPKIEKIDYLLSESDYNSNYCLGKISNFNSLIQKSQKFGVPVFELNVEQLGSQGAILNNEENTVEKFNTTFEKIAEKISNLISNAASNIPVSA